MQNRETPWRTPRKRGQRHSSLHVSRRQPKTKISSLRRTRGNRTRKRSSRSTRLRARVKAEADRKSAPQEEELELATSLANAKVRERELEKPETNRGTCLNIRKVRERELGWPAKNMVKKVVPRTPEINTREKIFMATIRTSEQTRPGSTTRESNMAAPVTAKMP